MNQPESPNRQSFPDDEGLAFDEFIKKAREQCHDLNQPMQAISGYADLIAMSVDRDDPLHGKIVCIQDAVQKANNIIMDLMRLLRSQASKKNNSAS